MASSNFDALQICKQYFLYPSHLDEKFSLMMNFLEIILAFILITIYFISLNTVLLLSCVVSG